MNRQVAIGWESFGRRLLDAMRLRSDTYRELARAPTAFSQAIAVILLGSLSSAAAFLIDGESPGLSVEVDWGSYPVTRESDAVAALAGAVIDAGWGLLIWAAQAVIIWWLWNRFSSRERTWRAVAAPLGFANAPLIVFGMLEIVPGIGGVLAAMGLLWTLVASVVAIRASLTVGWGRAVLLLVVSTIALLPIPIVISSL